MKKISRKKRKRLARVVWVLIFFVVLLVLVEIMTPKTSTEMPESTTTIPVTTLFTTTTPITTTVPVTTTLGNVTTTIQVRKPISIMAYFCDRDTDVISLTISNKGNTRIEEDEIKIYIDDEYIGTFGKAIDPGRLSENSFQGKQGFNTVKAVSPSNSARLIVRCY